MKDEKVAKDSEPCPDCESSEIYRHWNLVDDEWLDDGAYCHGCESWQG